LKLFLDSEELGDYISKNIKINKHNTNKEILKIWQYHQDYNEMNDNNQNKINLEDNTDLIDEYNNENMLDNNSETEKINEDKIDEDKN